MFTISNDELLKKPVLTSPTKCPSCGDLHDVMYGDIIKKDGTKEKSKSLAFVKCPVNGNCHLVGVNGKRI